VKKRGREEQTKEVTERKRGGREEEGMKCRNTVFILQNNKNMILKL